MSYRVAIYCPDMHLLYDGLTPMRKGIGGGVTARIRLARALARLGHSVKMICNTPKDAYFDNVHYIPVSTVKSIDADVLILSSSGDKLDLSPVLDLSLKVKLTIIWVHGIPFIGGIDRIPHDYLYTPSNFIRSVFIEKWDIPPKRIFVSYNGIEQDYFSKKGLLSRVFPRDPWKVIFTGGPGKGLNAARNIARILHQHDGKFTLQVFGSNSLYGKPDEEFANEDGIVYHGTIGQRILCQELMKASYALNLQSRPEPFGITIVESMAAGCIVIASPVGAYPEIIDHGFNGFLIPGDHDAEETQLRAAKMIQDLDKNPQLVEYIRRNAMVTPFDVKTYAQACVDHWDFALKSGDEFRMGECKDCGGSVIGISDGYHCTGCGNYSRSFAAGKFVKGLS